MTDTHNPTVTELKPCPFCGQQPSSRWQGCYENGDEGYWDITCSCGQAIAHEDDEETAIARWNTRASPIALSEDAVERKSLDTLMLGRFVAQYDEGAAGFFVDADEAQQVAFEINAALGLGKAIMDEIDADPSISTDVAVKVFAAIKRSHGRAIAALQSEPVVTPSATVDELAYHCEQARTYIAQPAASTPEKHMTSARWHLDKARALLNPKRPDGGVE